MSQQLPLNDRQKIALVLAFSSISLLIASGFTPWPHTLIPLGLSALIGAVAQCVWDNSKP